MTKCPYCTIKCGDFWCSWGGYMRTLILLESNDGSHFFEIKGDYSHLDGTSIGSIGSAKEKELSDLIYDKNGNFLLDPLSQPTKDWDYFICCYDVT